MRSVMANIKPIPKNRIFLYSSFRHLPYNYAGVEHTGYEVLITDVSDGVVCFVTHCLYRIEYLELNIEDFIKRFIPDFQTSPKAMARNFMDLTSFMTPVPLAIEKATSLYHAPHDPEEYSMAPTSKSVKPKTPAKKQPTATVWSDVNRRTCIMLDKTDGVVRYIPLNGSEGFLIELIDEKDFNQRYKEIEYPIDRAAKLYVEYAAELGASKEAMLALAVYTNVTQKEIDMATSKKVTRSTPAAKPAGNPKKTPAKPAGKAAAAGKAVAKTAAKTQAKAPATKKSAVTAAGDKKPSAATRFQELIMAGKLSDDQIFAKVQEEFGLDDNKRSYVKWYRNHLTKQGKNPPAAK